MEPIWIVPPALGAIGLAVFLAALLVSNRFDRKHPELSRRTIRDDAKRAVRTRSTMRRPLIPIPPFHPEEWDMEAVRDEIESDRLDRSLTRLGNKVASRPKPPAEAGSPAPR